MARQQPRRLGGSVKWTAGDSGLFSSPVIANIGGVRQVVSATQQSIVGVAVTTGEVLWRHPFASNGGITPILCGGDIVIRQRTGHGCRRTQGPPSEMANGWSRPCGKRERSRCT